MGIGLLLNGSIEVDNYKIYNTAKLQGEGGGHPFKWRW